jgi:cyclophilin family peptidyl-prolyl cis-trans isomerase
VVGPEPRALGVYRSIVQRTARPRTVEVVTDAGAFRLRLECPTAPLTCHNFLLLAEQGYYDGVAFHRVVPDFVVQDGDPRGDGTGGPDWAIRDEINRIRYERGVLGMALSGPHTGGSQWFVTLAPQPHLDGGYTAFGRLTSGEEVLDRILPGTKIERVREVP